MTGADVKAVRELYGLAQGDWGCLIGTSTRTVARWEDAPEAEASLNLGAFRLMRALSTAPLEVRSRILEAYDQGSWVQAQLVLLQHIAAEKAKRT